MKVVSHLKTKTSLLDELDDDGYSTSMDDNSITRSPTWNGKYSKMIRRENVGILKPVSSGRKVIFSPKARHRCEVETRDDEYDKAPKKNVRFNLIPRCISISRRNRTPIDDGCNKLSISEKEYIEEEHDEEIAINNSPKTGQKRVTIIKPIRHILFDDDSSCSTTFFNDSTTSFNESLIISVSNSASYDEEEYETFIWDARNKRTAICFDSVEDSSSNADLPPECSPFYSCSFLLPTESSIVEDFDLNKFDESTTLGIDENTSEGYDSNNKEKGEEGDCNKEISVGHGGDTIEGETRDDADDVETIDERPVSKILNKKVVETIDDKPDSKFLSKKESLTQSVSGNRSNNFFRKLPLQLSLRKKKKKQTTKKELSETRIPVSETNNKKGFITIQVVDDDKKQEEFGEQNKRSTAESLAMKPSEDIEELLQAAALLAASLANELRDNENIKTKAN